MLYQLMMPCDTGPSCARVFCKMECPSKRWVHIQKIQPVVTALKKCFWTMRQDKKNSHLTANVSCVYTAYLLEIMKSTNNESRKAFKSIQKRRKPTSFFSCANRHHQTTCASKFLFRSFMFSLEGMLTQPLMPRLLLGIQHGCASSFD